LDRKSHPFALFFSLFLVRRCSSKGSVEGDIVRFSVGWTSLDIATAFSVGLGARTSPSLAASYPVQRIIQLTWGKRLSDFNLIAPFPPV
jgi:hypothetical protein